MGVLEGPNNQILKADTKVQDAVEALAEHVDNQSKRIRLFGVIYKQPAPNEVQTVKVDGVEIGYRLEDHQAYMRRVIFIKVPGYKLTDLSPDEKERIFTAIFNVFCMPGGRIPDFKEVGPDCLRMVHDFVPDIFIERKPGLVSIAGGWEKPN